MQVLSILSEPSKMSSVPTTEVVSSEGGSQKMELKAHLTLWQERVNQAEEEKEF